MKRSCRLLHGQPRQPFEWNYFPLLTGRIVLWEIFEKIFCNFFFKAFSKKKVFGGPYIYKTLFFKRTWPSGILFDSWSVKNINIWHYVSSNNLINCSGTRRHERVKVCLQNMHLKKKFELSRLFISRRFFFVENLVNKSFNILC